MKLYIGDLDLRSPYKRVSLAARGLHSCLMRVAVETDNQIPWAADWLAFRLGCLDDLKPLLGELVTAHAITLADMDDSRNASRTDSTFALSPLSLPLTLKHLGVSLASVSPSDSERESENETFASRNNGEREPEPRGRVSDAPKSRRIGGIGLAHE